MQSPRSSRRGSQSEAMDEVVGQGVGPQPSRTRANSPTENGVLNRHTKSPSQARLPAPQDASSTPDKLRVDSDRPGHGSTTRFNLKLSSENDRTALTRYTHQTLTSLAAYRDALIDENGRLNAMLEKTKIGLVVLAGSSGVEPRENADIARSEHGSPQARSTSVVDIVKASMVEELQRLRSKAAQLKEADRLISESAGTGSRVAPVRRDLETQDTQSTDDPTMMIYYTIVNKLRNDLETSNKARDEAKAALSSLCRKKSAQSVDGSRVANDISSRSQRSWQAKSGDHVAGARGSTNVKENIAVASQTDLAEVTDVEALLPSLTDQEEAVWLRERREREMERALRDMRCYVEAMIREWREVGSLPPPGKYQTLSYPDLNLPYIPTQIFPKRKGRPPRTSVKVQQIPENLHHLLARGRVNRGIVEQAREREKERHRSRIESVPYNVTDALAGQRNAKRKVTGGASSLDEHDDDAARKRRRAILGNQAPGFEEETTESITRTTRDDSMGSPHPDIMHTGEASPHRQQEPLSADQLYGVSASAISDAMQAYTQQPMQDEASVFGPPEESFDSPDGSFNTQIPYQVQIAQRHALCYAADVNVPGTLVNGGNVFDNPDDIHLDNGEDHQDQLHHESDAEFAQSNPFRTYHQAAQDSVEGLIQRHIRNTQASADQSDSTLMQHVNGANLEVSDAQQAMDQYRFEDALMNHDITSPEAQHATTVSPAGLNADSEDATAIAAQRLMNSLAPQAEADFDTACENCGRRDTGAWRKLTIDGVDHKVCNACGLHYHKNGVMRPQSLWGDVAAQPKKRRTQRPYGANGPSDQPSHDLMMGDALYENSAGEDGDHYGEAAPYDPHFPEGEYHRDEEVAINTDDLPHYDLDLGQ